MITERIKRIYKNTYARQYALGVAWQTFTLLSTLLILVCNIFNIGSFTWVMTLYPYGAMAAVLIVNALIKRGLKRLIEPRRGDRRS